MTRRRLPDGIGHVNRPQLDVVRVGLDRSDGDALETIEQLIAAIAEPAAPSADELADHEPGAQLARLLSETEDAETDDFAAVETVAAWYRLTSWAQAGAARAAARLSAQQGLAIAPRTPAGDDARPGRGPESPAAHEIALRLAISRPGAQAMIETGRAITGPLSLVGDALEQGLIDLPRARAFQEGLRAAPLEIALEVQEAVLPNAPHRTVRQVRQDIARALIAVDEAEAISRHRSARNRRRVCRPTPLPDGMAGIWSVLPASDAVALDTALDAAAHTAKNAGDRRTVDQLRADALSSVGYRALETGHFGEPAQTRDESPDHRQESPAPTRGASRQQGAGRGHPARSRRAQIRVTVPLAALVPGVSNEPCNPGEPGEPSVAPASTEPCALGEPGAPSTPGGVTTTGAVTNTGDIAGVRTDGSAELGSPGPRHEPRLPEVAVLEGYGPVTPDVARALSLGGTWRRLVTDPGSGAVLDVGRSRYRPPAELAEFVRTRDGTCVRPGCSAAAQGCELDHTVPYELGGPTADWNLGCLCPADHAAKTAGGYALKQVRPGVFEVRTPSGHRYRRELDGSTTQLARAPSRERAPVAPPPPF